MPFVAVAILAAGVFWGLLYARRGSLALGAAGLIVVAYVFGHEFWNLRLGPLPLTLDRIVLAGLIGAFALHSWWGRIDAKPLSGADWLLIALLTILSVSTLFAGTPEVKAPEAFSATWRLVMSFVVPGLLYWIARDARLSRRGWQGSLAIVAALGVYLALTAVAEIFGEWSFVFPRYIADPTLGIHFGRARGPELNSASLGVYLTVCLWCAWLLWPQMSRGWQLVLLGSVPLMAIGIFATYTRSTWIGLAASGAVIGFIQLEKTWRIPVCTMALLVGALVTAATWHKVVGLEREGTASESGHSVDQRTSFAYVSWKMFKDHPVFGVGFGRFYDQKLPYLSDRSQDFELESIRGLHHHNTLLSLLTETGLLGVVAFLALLAAWGRAAWSLARDSELPGWCRSQGLLMIAVLVTYLSSAVFHDLSLLPSQQWIVFLMAGLTMNLRLGHVPSAAATAPLSVESGNRVFAPRSKAATSS
jgi:O-antigen ligase